MRNHNPLLLFLLLSMFSFPAILLAQQDAYLNLRLAHSAFVASQDSVCARYLLLNLNRESPKANPTSIIDTYKLIIELNDDLPKQGLPDDSTCMRRMLHHAPYLFLQDGTMKSRKGWMSVDPDKYHLVALHKSYSVMPVRLGLEAGATFSIPKLDSARPVSAGDRIEQRDYNGLGGFHWGVMVQSHITRHLSVDAVAGESQLSFLKTNNPMDSMTVTWQETARRLGIKIAIGAEWSTLTGGRAGPNGIRAFVNPWIGFSFHRLTYGAARVIRDDWDADLSLTTDSLVNTDIFREDLQWEGNLGVRMGVHIGRVSPYFTAQAAYCLTSWPDPDLKGDALELEVFFYHQDDLFRIHHLSLGMGIAYTPFVRIKKTLSAKHNSAKKTTI